MKLAYKKVLLVNEVGDEFTALSTEEFKPIAGELIFNTAMTGFTEILTDPSYINQIINFTSSHIGNYGVTKSDFESNKPKIQAAIGNSFSYKPSSWRSEIAITDWLKKYEISAAAVSGASDPCTELASTSSAKSLRIVPSSALAGLVAPINSRFF